MDSIGFSKIMAQETIFGMWLVLGRFEKLPNQNCKHLYQGTQRVGNLDLIWPKKAIL